MQMTESFNYCCNYRILNVVGINAAKESIKEKLETCSLQYVRQDNSKKRYIDC